ncbi:MAG: CDP-diacylglycerol--serine O-phosphatidyltransferase [Bacteroidales bacterium]|nr:CDP-diacylglycerol--serine O-phosphatidyltransferase [Bacteroidales bacterium]
MAFKKHIPNFITLLNLTCGLVSIVFFAEGRLDMAAFLVFLASMFDFMDGFFARLLKVYSPLGAQLDSLADVISFGVAPSLILFSLIQESHGLPDVRIGQTNLLPFVALMIPLFTALRLAKFNVDTRQSVSFIGLPSPASGLLLASLPLIKSQLYSSQSLSYMVFTNTYFYIGLAILMSLLMVSGLPLFGLKFKSFGFKGNEVRYLFLALALVLLFSLQFVAIPFIILLYILFSVVVYLVDIQG